MSSNLPDEDSKKKPQQAEDRDDVTEIVPLTPTGGETDNPDATQILPMRSSASPTQELPGTVIGVAGEAPSSAPSAPQQTSSPKPAPTANENETTKILFGAHEMEGGSTEDATAESETTEPKSKVEQQQPEPQSEATTIYVASGLQSTADDDFNPPVGWLVIIDGPGRGNVVAIYYGQNTIGRGNDQRIRLNFGDTRISRDTHAYLIYDEMARKFFLRDTGKANLVRHNQSPVMTPTELSSHDEIQIGETTLLFIPLCNDGFDWMSGESDPETGPGEDTKN